MKKILLIATGGTIASKVAEGGLAPLMTTEEILSYVPEIAQICEVEAVQMFNLDSSNLYYTHWLAIAERIRENYSDYDGFVITHGTDTMAYTASALSYLVQNSPKPIVLTGSQKSICMRDSDARGNLINAFTFAAHPSACLVHIVFEDKVIIGNRSRKIRTKSFNAFQSVDFPEVAKVLDGKVIRYVEERVKGAPVFYDKLDPRVFVLKLIPGENFAILKNLKDYCDALVIESFGVGNVPFYDSEEFSAAVSDWISSGRTIVVTTQVPHEGSDMSVYEAGNSFKSRFPVLEAYDMTLEAVVTKLMWALAISRDSGEIRKLFYTPVHKDIIE